MTKKKTAVFLLIFSVLAAAILIQREMLYLSHEATVNATVANLLAKNGQALPGQAADLAMLNQNSDIPLKEIANWETGQIELENGSGFFSSIRDDDPIYRLKAELQVTFADGSQATLAWESWRYGLVLGPIVVSLGDGPPGFIKAVTEG